MKDLLEWVKTQPRNYVFTYGFFCFIIGALIVSL